MAENVGPDIVAAKGKMRVKLGGGRDIKRLSEHLSEDEAVEQGTTGAYGNGTGLLALTDRRAPFVQGGVCPRGERILRSRRFWPSSGALV